MRTISHPWLGAAFVVTALVAAACGGDADPPLAAAPAAAAAPATPAALVAPAVPLPPDEAESFTSDGDPIAGWYWLRDAAGTQTAQWVFRDTTDTGAFDLQFEILATDQVNGGRGFPAAFWLTYGAASDQLGPAADEPQFVELPNVSPDSDPVGYTTRGSLTLETGALPNYADGIWVEITRLAPDGTVEANHIAVRATSVQLVPSGDGDGADEGDDTLRGDDTQRGGDGTERGEDGDTSTTEPPDTSGGSGDSDDNDGTESADESTTTTTTTTEPPDAGPPDGPPMIISLGDSYISGEAGRWAGNPFRLLNYSVTDALGSDAYADTPSGEAISGCHRSESAAIHIGTAEDGTPVASLNLACSGATTFTTSNKPGVDLCPDDPTPNRFDPDNATTSGSIPADDEQCPDNGRSGQVQLLREALSPGGAASDHHVEMVVLSIGGNNFRFADIVKQCVEDFFYARDVELGWHCAARVWGTCMLWLPLALVEDHCSDDAIADEVTAQVNLDARQLEIAASIQDIRLVMDEFHYGDDDWTLLVHTYPSPVPSSDEFRYGEVGWSRFSDGGCGFWDEDADWANETALGNIAETVIGAVESIGAPNIEVLDLTNAFLDRRLCEDDVYLVGTADDTESQGAYIWTQSDAVDLSEWVQQIRGIFSQGGEISLGPFSKNESLHPNYWGQLAIRNCVRQAYNNGDPVGGACVRSGNGLTGLGEPRMDVVP